jgi:hypothetical protein
MLLSHQEGVNRSIYKVAREDRAEQKLEDDMHTVVLMITAGYCSNTDPHEKKEPVRSCRLYNSAPIVSFPSVLAYRINNNHGIRQVWWMNIPISVNGDENQPA